MVENGGSVYFKVDKNRDTLSAFRGRNHIKAENGKAGEGRKKYGRKGKSVRYCSPPRNTSYRCREWRDTSRTLTED